MAFSINDIRAQLEFGGARGTLFRVQIQNPIDGSATLKIPFQVRAASIPESQLGTIMVPYFGRYMKLAGDRTFQPWETTVINDEDFKIRNSIETWSNKINKLENNIRDLPGSEASLYKSQGIVEQFSKTGTVIRTYQFNGIWPSMISPINLNWQADDAIEEYQIVWEYDWYEVTAGTTGSGGGS